MLLLKLDVSELMTRKPHLREELSFLSSSMFYDILLYHDHKIDLHI